MAEGSINLLLNIKDTSELFAPLPSARIKYACIATSSQHIALGANSGGVYCFSKDTLKYVQLLTNKEGPVSQVKFSPDGSWLAVVTGGGHVALWEYGAHKVPPWERGHASTLLKDAIIKALQWDGKGTRLFCGDDQGRVAAISLPKRSIVFKLPDELVFQAKESIVQIDVYQDTLLISTTQQCVLYRLVSRKVVQVGTKGRDGVFGACFDARWKDRPPVIFSARPGGRVWEADIEGTVLSTLKLKEFVTFPSSPILGPGYTPDFSQLIKTPSQALNFCSLRMFNKHYMVGWQEGVLFFFNPSTYTLAVWTAELPSILDVCADGGELVVLYCGGRRVGLLGVVSLEECVQTLVKEKMEAQGVQLASHYSSDLIKLLPSSKELIPSLQSLLESVQGDLPPSLQPLWDLLPKRDLLPLPHPPPVPSEGSVAAAMPTSYAGDATKPVVAVSGTGDEVVGGANAVYPKSPEKGTSKPALLMDDTDDQLPQQPNNPPTTMTTVGLLPWEQQLLHQSEQRLDLELEGTLPGMGSKEQVLAIGTDGEGTNLDGHLEELSVPSSSPLPDVDEGGPGCLSVGVAIQPSGKGTLPVAVEKSKGGASSSLPMAGGSPLMQLDQRGVGEVSDGSVNKVVASSVPDRMAIALQASASADDEDDVVAVPVRSGSGAVAISKHKGQKKRKKGSRKNSDASDILVTPSLSTPPPPPATLPQAPPSSTATNRHSPSVGSASTSPSLSNVTPYTLTSTPAPITPVPTPITPVPMPITPVPMPITPVPMPITPVPMPITSAPSTAQRDPTLQSPAALDLVTVRTDKDETDHPPPGPGQWADPIGPPLLASDPLPPPQDAKPENQVPRAPLESPPPRHDKSAVLASAASPSPPPVPRPPEKLSPQQAVMEEGVGVEGVVPVVKVAGLGKRESSARLLSDTQLKRLKDFFTLYSVSGRAFIPCATPTLDPQQCQDGMEGASVKAFMKATTIAIDQLKDLNVICSTTNLCAVLSDWFHQLESFSGPISPPSKTPVEGEVAATLSPSKTPVEGEVAAILSPSKTPVEGEVGAARPDGEQPPPPPPPHLEGLSSKYRGAVRWLLSLCLDLEVLGTRDGVADPLGDFVSRYWSLLDPGRAKMALGRRELVTRCVVWRKLAQDMQRGLEANAHREKLLTPGGHLPTSVEDIGKAQLSWLDSLPACMLSVLQLERSSFVPLCVATFPYTHPWEVAALLCGGQQATPTATPPPCGVPLDEEGRELLALYFDLLCAEGGKAKQLAKVLRSDPEVAMLALGALLLSEGPQHPLGQLKTEDDQPVPWSHLVEWRYGHSLEAVCSVLATLDHAHLSSASLLCREHGYWKGYLQLTMATRDVCTYLTTALALGDMRLIITQVHTDGPLLRTIADWKLLLQLMARVESVAVAMDTTDVDPSLHRVTWTGMFGHALRTLGPVVMAKLLSEVDLSSLKSRLGQTLPLLHTSLVELIAVHSQQRSIAHHLLESVDHYLWSSRPAVMGPQALYIHKHQEQQLSTDQVTSSSSNERVRTLEDLTHWGRRVWLEPGSSCVCGICRVPVLKPTVEHGPGVVTFPCGHFYHTQCLPELICLLCFLRRESGPHSAVC